MTKLDRAVSAAVPAWIALNRWFMDRRKRPAKERQRYMGPTPDDILERHGVTFSGDRREYVVAERMVRERASKIMGRTRLGPMQIRARS